jgi:hypothetical protein
MSDIPASRPSLSEQAQPFFYTVGLAVTEWAKIDEELFHICADALRTHGRLAAIVYYRANAIGLRLVLVDELVRAIICPEKRASGEHPNDMENDWKEIKLVADSLLPLRNQLAHSPASPRTEFIDNAEPGKPPVMADPWWAVYMGRTEELRGRDVKPEIRLDDIKKHIRSLEYLWHKMRDFRDSFARFPRLPV